MSVEDKTIGQELLGRYDRNASLVFRNLLSQALDNEWSLTTSDHGPDIVLSKANRTVALEFKTSRFPGLLPPSSYMEVLEALKCRGDSDEWILVTNHTVHEKVQKRLGQRLHVFYFGLEEPIGLIRDRLREKIFSLAGAKEPNVP